MGIAAEDKGLLMTVALTWSDSGLKQELEGQEQVDADLWREGVCLEQERRYEWLEGQEQVDADSWQEGVCLEQERQDSRTGQEQEETGPWPQQALGQWYSWSESHKMYLSR